MHISRTVFGKEIISEFLPPAKQNSKQEVIILASGMPTVPYKKEVLRFLSSKGFWVFYPRYRGSWESGGKFLKHSPDKDLLIVANSITKKFTDLWSGQKHSLKPTRISIIGASFGGAGAIIASLDKRIDRSVAVCPVVDWRKESKAEPLQKLFNFTKKAFNQSYRLDRDAYKKIKSGKFYNPINEVSKIDPSKLLVVQTADDKIVSPNLTKQFSKQTDSDLIWLKSGGHLGLSALVENANLFKKINKFIRK